MKKRMLGVLVPVILFVGGAHAATAPSLDAAIASGAIHLAAVQLPDAGWEWPLGGGRSYPNQFGVEGLGLLDAYARNGDAALVTAAVRTGDALVARYNAQSPKQRAYTTDVEFLAALGNATGNSTYSTTAAAWFGVTMTQYPNPADRVDVILAGRGAYRSMAAWDVGGLIRAAKAVGQTGYATGAAYRIVQRELPIVEGTQTLAGWKDTDPSHRWDQCSNPYGCGFTGNLYSYDYTLMGEGALLEAFQGLSGFSDQIAEYQAFLIAQQDPDGSWDVGDTQVSAFALRGLASTQDFAAKAAVTAATNYFLSQQLANGGWVSYEGGTTEYPEIDSETLSALARVRIPVVTVIGETFAYTGQPIAATAVANGVGGEPVSGNFAFSYAPGGPNAPVSVGTYAVTVNFTSTDGRYLDAAGAGSIVIEKAPQTIGPISAPATAAYNTSFTVGAVASSGLAVSFSVSGACSLSGATVTMTSWAGSCNIEATQSGNDSYLAAVPVTALVTAIRPVATTMNQCKSGGWVNLTRANGTGFKNQGDCVSYTNNGEATPKSMKSAKSAKSAKADAKASSKAGSKAPKGKKK